MILEYNDNNHSLCGESYFFGGNDIVMSFLQDRKEERKRNDEQPPSFISGIKVLLANVLHVQYMK